MPNHINQFADTEPREIDSNAMPIAKQGESLITNISRIEDLITELTDRIRNVLGPDMSNPKNTDAKIRMEQSDLANFLDNQNLRLEVVEDQLRNLIHRVEL